MRKKLVVGKRYVTRDGKTIMEIVGKGGAKPFVCDAVVVSTISDQWEIGHREIYNSYGVFCFGNMDEEDLVREVDENFLLTESTEV